MPVPRSPWMVGLVASRSGGAGAGADRAKARYGVMTTDRKICSTYRGSALTIFAAYSRARARDAARRGNNCVEGAPISLISQLTRVREERGGGEGAGGRRGGGGCARRQSVQTTSLRGFSVDHLRCLLARAREGRGAPRQQLR